MVDDVDDVNASCWCTVDAMYVYKYSSVLSQERVMLPPTKMPTPYGGRLIWKLPGGNNLVVHLKDKLKIRHKKRWSQVELSDIVDNTV
jgi:hypothetical protein